MDSVNPPGVRIIRHDPPVYDPVAARGRLPFLDRTKCPCSSHNGKASGTPYPAWAAMSSNQGDILSFSQRILPPEAMDWTCKALGCDRMLLELNSRLGTKFDLRNGFVAFSLDFCIQIDLDFATAYAYFLAATEVRTCTIRHSCELKTALHNWPTTSTLESELGLDGDRAYTSHTDCIPICRRLNLFGSYPQFDSWVKKYLWAWWDGSLSFVLPTAAGLTAVLGFVHEPYQSLPRRLWDLYSNRVIPSELITNWSYCQLCGLKKDGYRIGLARRIWSISHSWTNEMSLPAANQSKLLTQINNKEWWVPVPLGVSFSDVRREIVHLIHQWGITRPPTTDTIYCWLDVLCLRQKSISESDELLREREWEVDVPTIGQIYRISEGVIRYFNGLGVPFSGDNLDSARNWLNRAWTLQEIKSDNSMLTGGLDIAHAGMIPSTTNTFMTAEVVFEGQKRSLGKILEPLLKIATAAEDTSDAGGCSIMEIVWEMKRRHATGDIDKIAGLSFLLRSDSLPQYFNARQPEIAWLACLLSLRYALRVEILFNFPLVRPPSHMNLDDLLWTPTWQQMISHSQPSHSYIRPKIGATLLMEPDVREWATNFTFGSGFAILPVFNAIIMDQCEISPPTVCTGQGTVCWSYKVEVTRAQSPSGAHSTDKPKRSTLTFCSPPYHVPQGATMNVASIPESELIRCLPPPIPTGKYILVTHSLKEWSGWVVAKKNTKGPGINGANKIDFSEANEIRMRSDWAWDSRFGLKPLESREFLTKVGILHTHKISCPAIQEDASMWVRRNCYFL